MLNITVGNDVFNGLERSHFNDDIIAHCTLLTLFTHFSSQTKRTDAGEADSSGVVEAGAVPPARACDRSVMVSEKCVCV